MPQSKDSSTNNITSGAVESVDDSAVDENQNNGDALHLQGVPMSKRVKKYRYLALIGHLGLLLWMSIWYLGLSGARDYSITFIFIVYLLPLLFPLHGIIKAKPYTHAWSCFVVLWYLMHSATTMYVEPTYLLHALLEMLFVIMMFVGCAMFARLRGQELGTGLPKLSKVMELEKERFES